jgi:rubrerythrin
MPGGKQEMLKWLNVALDYEREGLLFYTKAANEAENALSRRLFWTLASQEIEHTKKIEEIYTMIERDKKLPSPEKLKKVGAHIELEKDIKEFFKAADRESLRKNAGNVEAMKIAMEIEKKSYRLYVDLVADARNTSEKAFLSALRDEEQKHIDALDNVYYYLTNSEMWFAGDESRVWNWMGT